MIDYDVYEDGDGKVTYVWIDEVLPPDFERRLLTELLALSEPVGFGAVEALGRKSETMDAILDEGLQKAAFNHRGHRNIDEAYRFDYVSGYRIKVEYLPLGLSIFEDSPEIHLRNPGMPLVVSSEFDEMYGDGALAGAIKLALTS